MSPFVLEHVRRGGGDLTLWVHTRDVCFMLIRTSKGGFYGGCDRWHFLRMCHVQTSTLVGHAAAMLLQREGVMTNTEKTEGLYGFFHLLIRSSLLDEIGWRFNLTFIDRRLFTSRVCACGIGVGQ